MLFTYVFSVYVSPAVKPFKSAPFNLTTAVVPGSILVASLSYDFTTSEPFVTITLTSPTFKSNNSFESLFNFIFMLCPVPATISNGLAISLPSIALI